MAGTIGTLLVVFTMPLMTKFAISMGAPEYFAVILLAFIAVTAVLGTSRIRGFSSLMIGLAIGIIGIDATSGQSRLSFGVAQLGDGVDVIVVAVGIFALGEALWVAAHLRHGAADVIPVGRPFLGKQDCKRSWKPWLRGTALGFPFGAVPAGGAEIPTFLSYITEKKLTKHPEEFGKGAIEGVAGPEAANNASAAGTFVPMLSLGLPTNATAAVLLAALVSYGIQPGPLLLQRESTLVWALLASLLIGNTLLVVLNLPLAPLWAKLLRIPRPYLYAGILFFAAMGAYAVNGSPFDLILLLGLGIIGFGMRRFGLPVLPLIVAVIMGPLIELQCRRALQLASGSPRGLIGGVNVATGLFALSPLCVTIYAIIVLVLIWPLVYPPIKRRLLDGVTEAPTDAPDHNRRDPEMIIVVGYTPTKPGQAALLAGIEEAQQRHASLVVLNTSRGDAIMTPVSPSRQTSTGSGPRALKQGWSSASAKRSGAVSRGRRWWTCFTR